MKSIIKLVLVVILFNSAVFADGEMGSGTKTCTGTCVTETQPTGSETTGSTDDTTSTGSEDSTILTYVQEYWDSVFNYFEN
jgi:hypothetical protein